MIYARIANGCIAELFSTDGDITTMSSPDFVWADVTDLKPQPEQGWTAELIQGQWVLAEPVIPPITAEQLKAAALVQRDALLSMANEKTVGMADAFIAGLLDEADTLSFKAYAAYKLALNKIDKQLGFPQTIKWPVPPA